MNNPFNPNNQYDQQQPVMIQPPGSPQSTPPSSGAMGIQFSHEDMEVLKQCELESLVNRSFPIGTALGVGAYVAIQKGILKPSLKYGATPKVLGACLVGYVIGKISYQSICAEKLMKLPNSQVGEMLRRQKGAGLSKWASEGGLSMSPFSSQTQKDVYTDEGVKSQQRQNSLDFDRPLNYSGLDDTYRPSLDSPERSFDDNLPLEPPKSSTSYEELRRRNREDYGRRMNAPFSSQPLPSQPREDPFVNRPVQPRNDDFPSQLPNSGGLKNKYGDEWK